MKYLIGAALAALSISANAVAVAEVDGPDGSVIQLHDEANGLCAGEAKYAEWISKTAEKVRGCWTASGPFVLVVFLDGDTAKIPLNVLRPPKSA